MSKRTIALIAALFAAGLMSANPAWADRGGGRFDRGHGYGDAHRGGNQAWGWGLGLLAGTAILVAATQPRPVVIGSPVQVYGPPAPRFAVYSPPAVQWWYYCAQSAAYYPHVNYCPSGWTKVPATPMQ
ncbi:MAG: hypothetical protein D4S02_03955 [Rhodocyclaceae bacterium]|nr:MAG: hypothetical protein D4S02_03955 [Rhodocyclaceae bacterium]